MFVSYSKFIQLTLSSRIISLLVMILIPSMYVIASNHNYSYGPKSTPGEKPKLSGFLVKLQDEDGISILDLEGNIISRNFTPYSNAKGEVSSVNTYNTPIINDIFCVGRRKGDKFTGRTSYTIYRNASDPIPIDGLQDLYDANIIDPNLFPICKYNERIKFVDSKGNVKFTVMPIDGKEPRSVYPFHVNGLIIVITDAGYGAIDISGRWVLYPDWDKLWVTYDGVITGWKDSKLYRFDNNNKPKEESRFYDLWDITSHKSWPIRGKYIVETFEKGDSFTTNLYGLDYKYITTFENTINVDANHCNDNILKVKRWLGNSTYDYLYDLSTKKIISKEFIDLIELPNGDYMTQRFWGGNDYVQKNGNNFRLPPYVRFPFQYYPLKSLRYEGEIQYLFVESSDEKPGYLCNFRGERIGSLQIEEFYYNSDSNWPLECVRSDYYYRNRKK